MEKLLPPFFDRDDFGENNGASDDFLLNKKDSRWVEKAILNLEKKEGVGFFLCVEEEGRWVP